MTAKTTTRLRRRTHPSALALVLALASVAPVTGQDDAWQERLVAIAAEDWQTAFRVGCDVADLPPDRGFAILAASWSRVVSPAVRQQLLKAWFYTRTAPMRPRMHPRLIDAIELGLDDEHPKVRDWAIGYLRMVAFEDYAGDVDGARAWVDEHKDRPLGELVPVSVARCAQACAVAQPDELTDRLETLAMNWTMFRDDEAVRRAAHRSFPPLMRRWFASGDVELVIKALRAAQVMLLPGEFVREQIVPLIDDTQHDEVRAAAIDAVGSVDTDWSLELLVRELHTGVTRQPTDRARVWAAARALAELGDRRAIPAMIAAIETDTSEDTRYGVGHFGLGRLTGVAFDRSHDGAWWRAWWSENKARFPDARDLPILQLARAAAEPAARDANDRRAGGDENKRYFLHGPRDARVAPEHGYRLLVVMPGGDGGAEFRPFCRRIHENAAGDGWITAQLVAPRWSPLQARRVVWPTGRHRFPGMQFTTEQFVDAVIEDVGREHRIDPSAVFVLAWSSGGPAAYAVSLEPGTRVRGTFAAMSVFQSGNLPSLRGADGHAYFILHAPDDATCPFRLAERARDRLAEAGATVRLQTYDGGHGWPPDCFDRIRAGLRWLTENRGSAERSDRRR